jgi:hypothetical protein
MDAVEALRMRRQLPDVLEPLAQQVLLNLITGGEGSTELWIKVGEDNEPVNYADIIVARHEEINRGFDDLMVRLGFPEGSGKLI